MGSLSDYSELKLLDHVCNVAYSPVATVYLALCTGDPTDAGTGAAMSECADANAYARTAITFAAAGTPTARQVDQNADVDFPQASGGGWGLVTHWAIVDGNTHGAGNMLAHGAFAAGKTINDGDTPSVASGEIYVNFAAGEISTYLAEKLLDLMFRNQAYSKPATYVALATAILDDDTTGTTIAEPAGGSYARKQVNINGGSSPTWDLATDTTPAYVDNTHAITFVTATGDWGTIVAVAIIDALTTGNVLFYDNAMTDKAVNDGDTAVFPIGDLDIQMS